VGALPTDGEALAVANTLVAPNFDLALDVVLNVTTKVTLNRDVRVDP